MYKFLAIVLIVIAENAMAAGNTFEFSGVRGKNNTTGNALVEVYTLN